MCDCETFVTIFLLSIKSFVYTHRLQESRQYIFNRLSSKAEKRKIKWEVQPPPKISKVTFFNLRSLSLPFTNVWSRINKKVTFNSEQFEHILEDI